MEPWQLAAREAIRDTIAQYTWRAEFMEEEAFGLLFREDAVLEIKGGRSYRGRNEIRGMLGATRERAQAGVPAPGGAPVVLRHHVSSIRIELDARDRARAFSYFAVFGPEGPDHWGRYADELVPEGDRWLFARRRVSVDGAAPTSRLWPMPGGNGWKAS
jgi:hypothetical protein